MKSEHALGIQPRRLIVEKMQIFLLSLELLQCDIDGRIRLFFPPPSLSGASPMTRHVVKGFCVNIKEDVK